MFIKPYQESADYSKKYAQEFDRKKIEFKRNGKMVNLYDWIQEQNQDLEVYEVLEKGKTLDSMQKNVEQIYGDMREANSLRNICDRKVAVNNIFETLPHQVRRIFNNDLNNFIENGEQYFADLAKEQTIEQPKEQQKQEEVKEDVQK